jgi:hypothetical protein
MHELGRDVERSSGARARCDCVVASRRAGEWKGRPRRIDDRVCTDRGLTRRSADGSTRGWSPRPWRSLALSRPRPHLEQISKLVAAHVRIIEDADEGSALHWMVQGNRYVPSPVLHSHMRAFYAQLRPAGTLERAHEVDPAHDGVSRSSVRRFDYAAGGVMATRSIRISASPSGSGKVSPRSIITSISSSMTSRALRRASSTSSPCV